MVNETIILRNESNNLICVFNPKKLSHNPYHSVLKAGNWFYEKENFRHKEFGMEKSHEFISIWDIEFVSVDIVNAIFNESK